MKTEIGAPVVASEMTATTTNETAPVMPEVKPAKARKVKAKTAAPTIVRRKVLAGQHKMTGAPKLEVLGLTKSPRKGAFTLKEIFHQNGETISLLTIKKRKMELVNAGKLVIDLNAAKRQHEGHGRPPQYFNFDTTQGKVKQPRARKTKAAPVVAAEPAMNMEAAREFVENVELPAPPAAPAEPVIV